MPKLLPTSDRERSASPPDRPVQSIAPTCRRISLQGRVQGLGVRPAIARLGRFLAVTGWVGNSSQGVEILVEGGSREVQEFLRQLPKNMPAGAVIERMLVEAAALGGHAEFLIVPSKGGTRRAARVPADVAVCQECLSDVSAFESRRHAYVFTTCTACGPRYSLIDAMPYDRRVTGMAGFELCARCRQEYLGSTDRRFHSQTNCCPDCGPRLWLSDRSGRLPVGEEGVVRAAIQSLRSGRIVAVRGVGGYQLMADATSPAAVAELRKRKQRRGKPLAVMVADLAAAEKLARIDSHDRRSLCDPANPIVLAHATRPSCLATNVAEGLDTVGLLLPTTPLHDQLSRSFGGPLVVTSGNLEGQPLVFDEGEAQLHLTQMADSLIHHDRPILRPIDDSVVRVIAGRSATLRLGRGLAPLPLELNCPIPLVALGGHQKAAIALSNGAQAVLGPHVGDLDDEATRVRFVEHFESMCKLYDTEPAVLVHDDHPDYFTTRWAEERHVATVSVQHHHAHVAAGMLEQGWLDRAVLGVAWDGTGYGPDGTVWGGEFLIATDVAYRRIASLRPFVLPGGAMAIREPWRTALALVHETRGAEPAAALALPGVSPREKDFVAGSLLKLNRWPPSTSAGRLFDGVAALVLGSVRSDFEGQGAMLLEAACDSAASGEYPLPLGSGEPATLDWRPLIQGVLTDLELGVPAGTIAMRFHRCLASGIVELAEKFAHLPLVLCGGCFHNRVLTELIVEQLDGRSRAIATPGTIPAGDGGLAAGQLAVAAARIAKGWQPCA